MRFALATTVTLSLVAGLAQARTVANPLESSDKRKLAAGEYLISLEKKNPCRSIEMNIEKELVFDQENLELDAVLLRHDSNAEDNLMHAEVCRAGTSYAQVALTLPNTATLVTQAYRLDSPLKITKIEAITSKSRLQNVDEETVTLSHGQHLVQLQGMGSCADAEVNIRKFYEYDGYGQTYEIQLSRGSTVMDNLIRPMICRMYAIDRAEVLIEVKEGTVIRALDGLKVVGTQKILAKENIDGNNADSISCYGHGENRSDLVILNIENKKVASASYSIGGATGIHNNVTAFNKCRQVRNPRRSVEATCRNRSASTKIYVMRGQKRVIVTKWDWYEGYTMKSLQCAR